jgi:hypothetical protein
MEAPEQRISYKKYLSHSAQLINRFYPDHATGEWITVENFFLNHIVNRFPKKYALPKYSKQYGTRLDYIVDLFRHLDKHGAVFGKNPKWLNDFSGHTIDLFHELINADIPICGLYLTRCPADTFTSILDRKLRLDELFEGDIDRYAQFIIDSIEFSTTNGLQLAEQYNFVRIRYESLASGFSDFLSSMDIDQSGKIRYARKYGHRYILNPRARRYSVRLQSIGGIVGYNNYPKKITLGIYLKELLTTIVKSFFARKNNVNNIETVPSILAKCFWLEIDTPNALPLKKVYRTIKKDR